MLSNQAKYRRMVRMVAGEKGTSDLWKREDQYQFKLTEGEVGVVEVALDEESKVRRVLMG